MILNRSFHRAFDQCADQVTTFEYASYLPALVSRKPWLVPQWESTMSKILDNRFPVLWPPAVCAQLCPQKSVEEPCQSQAGITFNPCVRVLQYALSSLNPIGFNGLTRQKAPLLWAGQQPICERRYALYSSPVDSSEEHITLGAIARAYLVDKGSDRYSARSGPSVGATGKASRSSPKSIWSSGKVAWAAKTARSKVASSSLDICTRLTTSRSRQLKKSSNLKSLPLSW